MLSQLIHEPPFGYKYRYTTNKYCKKKALASTTLKPKCWYRYVDDTFIIWPHGRNTVAYFLDHINGIHLDIQLVYHGSGENAALPLLDVLVERKPDGSLDINEIRHFAEELEHLRTALRGNGYTARNIERAIRRKHYMKKREYLATTYLPYVKGCTDKIGRLLKKRNINTVFSTVKKVAAAFPNTCNNDQLQGPGVYSIPCSCGMVYIGQTRRHIKRRLKEHKSHLQNNNWEKSVVAEHRADTGHTVDRNEANMVVREGRFGPDYTEKH
ncbi:uncharacterized protein LOC108903364 [Anoplophora glabripennis]|uniref:uncharacterized protein LOC108903364 n=1 Tax=Anoplophora glabripennis TaxID=217634 RepID=UPI00087512B7|nr:uncharacterized protein LOC108903364 [Anoplophora glabripennis]